MPAKHTVKTYIENGIYHVYNRGVEKRNIFLTSQDYHVFLQYLKEALSDPKSIPINKTIFTLKGGTFKGIRKQPKNFYNKISLFAFCLMPNHFHLLLQQTGERDIKQFMQSLITRYSMYFNKNHNRVGGLFQNHYKASLVMEEPYLLHLSRYIHLNPIINSKDLTRAYSSYADYLGNRHTQWIYVDFILSFFQKNKLHYLKRINTYKEFVESYKDNDEERLGSLTLEETS